MTIPEILKKLKRVSHVIDGETYIECLNSTHADSAGCMHLDTLSGKVTCSLCHYSDTLFNYTEGAAQ